MEYMEELDPTEQRYLTGMYEKNKKNHQNELMMMIEEQNEIHQELEKLFGNDWKNIRRKFGDDSDGVIQGIKETKNGLLHNILQLKY